MVQAKVKKWGSSMAVLIPRQFARSKRIDVGSVVDLENLQLINSRSPRYKLSQLMSGFKRRHRHGEWELGGPRGREIW